MRPLRRPTIGTGLDSVEGRVTRLERRYRLGDAFQERKLFADRGALDGQLDDQAILVVAGNGKARWNIAPDLGNHILAYVVAWVSVASASDIDVRIHNVTQALDLVTVTIPGGEQSSECVEDDMTVPDDTPTDLCDEIRIDVTDDGDGLAEGLFVTLCWRPAPTL